MSYDYGVTLSSLRHWPVTTGKELLEAATHRPAGGVEITKGGRPLESAIDVDGESHLGAQNRRGPLQPHPDDEQASSRGYTRHRPYCAPPGVTLPLLAVQRRKSREMCSVGSRPSSAWRSAR